MEATVEESFHISSFVVRCLPDRLEAVLAIVQGIDGVEVHGVDSHGKFVALLDMDTERQLVQTITEIEQIKGVINTSMVYHHAE